MKKLLSILFVFAMLFCLTPLSMAGGEPEKENGAAVAVSAEKASGEELSEAQDQEGDNGNTAEDVYSRDVFLTLTVPVVGEPVGAAAVVSDPDLTFRDEGAWNVQKILWPMVTSGTFEAGKTYCYTCRLSPPEGMLYGLDDSGAYQGKITLNGKELQYISDKAAADLLMEMFAGGAPDYFGYNIAEDRLSILYSAVPLVPGDADGDGDTDGCDAALILQYSAGIADIAEENRSMANMDGDESITPADAARVLKSVS